MTLTLPYNEIQFVSDGVIDTYSFSTFAIQNLTQLVVDIYNAAGVLVNPALYPYDANITDPTSDLPRNSIVFSDDVPPENYIIVISRLTEQTQEVSFSTLGGYNSKNLENILSKIVQMIQEEGYKLDHNVPALDPLQTDWLFDRLLTNNSLLYIDTINKTIKQTSFPKENVVQATGGMYLRQVLQNGYYIVEYSMDNVNWTPILSGGAADYHNNLLGRDVTGAHPASAITGVAEHIADTDNPHSVTKTQVGLGNCDNTSDADKPVSTATQTALNAKANLSGAIFTDAISATNLSGTNTGDETKETIIEKLDGEFEPKITYPTENPETKYYRGDGTFQEIAIGSGGYAANLYFTVDDSDVSGYKKISYELPSTETELPATFSGTQLLRTYLFDAGIDTTLIDAGLWSANFSSKLNSSGGVTYLRGEVFLRHIDDTETTLFSATSPELNNTLEFLVIRIESNQPSFACVATDRLGMRVYGVTNRDPNVTLTTIIGDGRASYFNTPLKLRHSQLRDLNGDTGFLHHSIGAETYYGVKTFDSSPIIPTPTTDYQAATKKYVDDNAGGGGSAILPSGTCSTAGTTAAKEVMVTGYTETAGACALITFANKNYALGPNLYIPFTGGTAADPLGIYTLTTIGSPTYTGDKFNSNGLTGLSYNIPSLGAGTWCIQGLFKSTNIAAAQDLMWGNADYTLLLRKTNGNKLQLFISAGSTWGVVNGVSGSKSDWGTGTEYYIRVRFTGTQYLVDWSTDGINWTNDITSTSSTTIVNIGRLTFGVSHEFLTNPLIGTMDDLYVSIGSATTITDYPTLNINGGGAKYLCHADGTRITPANPAYFIANCPIQFCYDGTGYRFKRELVKRYINGTTFWNSYNDYWLEQGFVSTANRTTLTLPVPMANTNYYRSIALTRQPGGAQAGVIGGQYLVNATASTIVSVVNNAAGGDLPVNDFYPFIEIKGFPA